MRRLEAALRATGGDVDLAAKRLGIRKHVVCSMIVRADLEELADMPWRDVTRPQLVALLKRYSMKRVAKELQCSPATINKYMGIFGIEMPGRTFEDTFGEVRANGHVMPKPSLPLEVYRELYDIAERLNGQSRKRGPVHIGAAIVHVMEENRRLREQTA